MLSYIVDLFKSIGNLIVSLISFIVDAIFSIFNLIGMIPTYITYLSNTIGILPTFIIPFLIGIVSIHVVWTFRKAV